MEIKTKLKLFRRRTYCGTGITGNSQTFIVAEHGYENREGGKLCIEME